MITDPAPRARARRALFDASEALVRLPLPEDDRLTRLGAAIEAALATGACAPVHDACAALLGETARFYDVPPPGVSVLAARPLRVRERNATELFGDYTFETQVIRIWMRTAVQKRVTSFGTLLSTLVHEFCHHLDVTKLGFPDTPHTRGFYERTAVLYHHARGTPLRPLAWKRRPDGRWQIDWTRMRTKGGG